MPRSGCRTWLRACTTRRTESSTGSSSRTSTGITCPDSCRRERSSTPSKSARSGSPGPRIREDELANELRKRKQKRLNGIVAAAELADRNDTPAARRTADQLESLLNFHGDLGAAGTKTTGKALEWVKARQAPIKYLRPG